MQTVKRIHSGNVARFSNIHLSRTFLPMMIALASLTLSGRLSAEPASVSSIAPEDLVEFGTQTPDMKKLIRSALSLTKKNLRYTFGSNSPSRGGMDCSGVVQFTLSEMGLTKVPRTSFDFYQWVKTSSKINPARKIYDISNPAFAQLKPGDLLFWEGTYNAAKNNPPVSHVMIYLGTLKADNRGVMFGSSSGRRYRGKKIHGVSVFDFKIPSKSSSAKFIGYGAIPGLSNKLEETITAAEKKKKNKVSFLEWLGFKKKKVDSVSLGESKPVATPVLNETPQGLKKEQGKTE